jgi:FixJ family two-component response regulator
MPGVSGIDLQQRLFHVGCRIPTIFMTAHADEHIRIAALKSGALGFLTKPISEERLLSCLEGALGLTSH